MPVRLVRAEDAVGKILAYDVSIVTESRKGALFRRGHIILSDDVKALKDSGHYYVYVADSPDDLTWGLNEVFEDEAVKEVAEALAGPGTRVEGMAEGKALIKSTIKGLLKIEESVIRRINLSNDFTAVTLRNNSAVSEGDTLAIIDLIPLTIPRQRLEAVKNMIKSSSKPVIQVKPFKGLRTGLLVIATEVYEGRIKDKATPVIKGKLMEYGCVLSEVKILPDDEELIAEWVREFASRYDLVIATGGMSVDPTDKTPEAIKSVADEVVTYGIPVKPNTMTMIAYVKGKPVIGLPSSIIFFRDRNVLDVILPRIAAGERWGRDEIASLGVGGLSTEFIGRVIKHAD